ncbi:MAG: RDD family protein [Dehalococcoidia bacterium]
MDEMCGACGSALPANAAYCGACGEPANWRDQIDLGGWLRTAPMGKRVLAFGIDIAVVYGAHTAFNVLGMIAGFGLQRDARYVDDYRDCIAAAATAEARADCASELLSHLWGALLVGLIVPFVIAMVYWAGCNVRGVSVGKYAAGIRIVNARGGRPGVGRGIARTLAALLLSSPILLLGYWWAFWQPQRRTWHDMIAGTYAVRVPPSGLAEADATDAATIRAL